jgi:dTDP-4-amino-4,6-dideoxygalactose transaminase
MSMLATPSTRVRVPFLDLRAMHEEIRPTLDHVWRASVDGSAFIGGDDVRTFEIAWAEACGRRHAIGVANGTDAISLALKALDIGPGDEVIVPANTFIATAEGVLAAGAIPRFVDVDPETHLINAETVEAAIGPRTRAIVVVHLHGNMPDMSELTDLADAHRLLLVEDAAQAHGSTWQGLHAGSFGIASCFSFYPAKNLGAFGDAGAVVTDDDSVAARIRSLANHGRAPESANFHPSVGINSRLDAIQAAVLSAKLPALESWNAGRWMAAARYDAALLPLSEHVTPLRARADVTSSYHHYIVRTLERDRLQAELATEGIETAIHYPIPCHQQPPYRFFATVMLPVCEQLASEILSLPMFPHLTDEQIDLVCGAIGRFVIRGLSGRAR